MKNIVLLFVIFLLNTNLFANKADSVYNAALEYKEKDNLTETAKLMKMALDLDKENKSFKENLADVQYKRKVFYEAIPLYEEVLVNDKNNVVVLARLSEMYSMSPKKMKGIEYADQAIKLKPKDPEVIKMLARTFFEVKHYPKAIQLYQEAEKSLTEDKDIPFKIAKCYVGIADNKSAMAYYKKAFTLDPENSAKIYEAGRSCYDAGQYVDAVNFFQLAEDKGMIKTKSLYENWAMSCEELKDFDKALFYYSKAKEFSPYDKSINLDISEVYLKKGNYERSREILDELLEINPKDAEVLYSKGMTYYKQGNTSKAEKYFNDAFEIDPSLKSLRFSKMN